MLLGVKICCQFGHSSPPRCPSFITSTVRMKPQECKCSNDAGNEDAASAVLSQKMGFWYYFDSVYLKQNSGYITGLKWVYPDWEDYDLGILLIMLPVSKYSPMSVSINCWTQMCIKDERGHVFSSRYATIVVVAYVFCLCTTFLAVALFVLPCNPCTVF